MAIRGRNFNAYLVFATAIARITETAAYSSRARRGLAVRATTRAETALYSSAGDDRPLCARSRHSWKVGFWTPQRTSDCAVRNATPFDPHRAGFFVGVLKTRLDC
jgi:hypothetical protein